MHKGSPQHLFTPPHAKAQKSCPIEAQSFCKRPLPTSHKARGKPQESTRVMISLPWFWQEELFRGLVNSIPPSSILSPTAKIWCLEAGQLDLGIFCANQWSYLQREFDATIRGAEDKTWGFCPAKQRLKVGERSSSAVCKWA